MIFDKLKAYGAIAAALVLVVLLVVQTARLHTAQLDAANTRTQNAQTLAHIADLTAKAERDMRMQLMRTSGVPVFHRDTDLGELGGDE